MNTIFLSASESTNTSIGALFFLLPFIAFAVYGGWVSLRYFYWYRIKEIDRESKNILLKHYKFYKELPQNHRKTFENRVMLFIMAKDWYGQEGLIITQEMKVLVAATAVQITFGFRFYQLPRFRKIFIYPRAYFSTRNKKRHKGEVNPGGKLIKLSWDNFLHGHHDPTDGINLGIHEMTHAMSLENGYGKNGDVGFILPHHRAKWRELAQMEIYRIKNGSESLFRAYAATNFEEFLAVSVEVFFEKPKEFKEYNSKLFVATCDVLNQYPVFD